MKNWIILVFLAIPMMVQSQVPGFAGRRFYVQGGINLGLAIQNPTDYRNPEQRPGVNWRVDASFNFVTGQHTSVGLSFQHFNTAAYVTNYNDPYIPQPLGAYANVKIYGFGVNIKKFFGGNLAPVGPYFKAELGVAYMNADLYNAGYTSRIRQLETATSYIVLSFGRQHVFFKRLLVDYGFSTAGFGLESLFYWSSSSQYDDAIAVNDMKRRLLQHSLFNFYGSVGVIF